MVVGGGEEKFHLEFLNGFFSCFSVWITKSRHRRPFLMLAKHNPPMHSSFLVWFACITFFGAMLLEVGPAQAEEGVRLSSRDLLERARQRLSGEEEEDSGGKENRELWKAGESELRISSSDLEKGMDANAAKVLFETIRRMNPQLKDQLKTQHRTTQQPTTEATSLRSSLQLPCI